jgi:hypothetical protein
MQALYSMFLEDASYLFYVSSHCFNVLFVKKLIYSSITELQQLAVLQQRLFSYSSWFHEGLHGDQNRIAYSSHAVTVLLISN